MGQKVPVMLSKSRKGDLYKLGWELESEDVGFSWHISIPSSSLLGSCARRKEGRARAHGCQKG